MRCPLLVLLTASILGCSAIGDPGGSADAYPHGGTGQFRVLSGAEVGTANGQLLPLRNVAFDAVMVVDGYLFYTAAALLEEPPEPPDEHPDGEVYWPAFEPRAIHRAEPREVLSYRSGVPILEAEETWEGSALFDPWVVVVDGRARLYYAGEGGIGVAEATSLDGTFARVGDGPVLENARRPSVIRGLDGAWWMYFDAGGHIGVARSEDGLAFEPLDADPSTEALDPIVIEGEDLGESPETSVGMPGALLVETPAGRQLVRLYYESRREDGSTHVYVAGSVDGLTFERHELSVMDQDDVRAPAPLVVDPRVTLLYVNVPAGSTYATRALRAAVTPAGVRFDAPGNDG